MRSRGVRKIFQDENGNYIALCADGSMWITREINFASGKALWVRVQRVPDVNA